MEIGPGVIILLLFVIILSSAIHTPEVRQTPSPTAIEISETQGEVQSFFAAEESADEKRIEKFIFNYAPKVSAEDAGLISQCIVEYGREFDVNPRLTTALIALESRFNKASISSSGAIGLGQLMPDTARGLKVDDPFDIRQNVYGTVRYFRSMLDRWKGLPNQIHLALASYKEGPNALQRSGGQISEDAEVYIRVIMSIYQKI